MQFVLLFPMLLITIAKNLKRKDAKLKRRGYDPTKKGEFYKPGPLRSGYYWLMGRKKLVIVITVLIMIVGLFLTLFLDVVLFGKVLTLIGFMCGFLAIFMIFLAMFSMEAIQERSLHPAQRSLYQCNSCNVWVEIKTKDKPLELECTSCGAFHILPDTKEVKDIGKEYEFILCPICKSDLMISKPVTGPVICRCGVEIFEP